MPGSGPPFCGFADKFDNVQAKGWDGLIVFNQVRPDDGQVNMLTGDGGDPRRARCAAWTPSAPTGVLADGGDPTTPTPAAAPPARTSSIGQEFDGWGYAHLYDAKTGEELDAYAIAEGAGPALRRRGSATSPIHEEIESTRRRNLAFSFLLTAGGIRILPVRTSQSGLEEVGAYIADGGSQLLGRRAVHGGRTASG